MTAPNAYPGALGHLEHIVNERLHHQDKVIAELTRTMHDLLETVRLIQQRTASTETPPTAPPPPDTASSPQGEATGSESADRPSESMAGSFRPMFKIGDRVTDGEITGRVVERSRSEYMVQSDDGQLWSYRTSNPCLELVAPELTGDTLVAVNLHSGARSRIARGRVLGREEGKVCVQLEGAGVWKGEEGDVCVLPEGWG